jgi:hypothetical protein
MRRGRAGRNGLLLLRHGHAAAGRLHLTSRAAG